MKDRFRTITSGLVVVKILEGMEAPLERLRADMSALHSAEMNHEPEGVHHRRGEQKTEGPQPNHS